MSSIVLGFCAPASSLSAERGCRRAFLERAMDLGLSVHLERDRHAIAVDAVEPIRPRPSSGPWRVGHFDGHLHCRSTLTMYGVRPEGMDDAAIVEQLLNAHGIESLAWLLGDWAVAAISSSGLLLASDYFGNRALFYHQDEDGGVVWSNHHWVVAEYAGRQDALDKAHLAGFVFFLPSPDSTPFQGVRAVPAGFVTRLDGDRLVTQPYWSPRVRQFRLADPREYAERFVQLLREGVEERLVVPGRKWVEISGGVDSALIASCASSCVRNRSTLGPIEAVHYTTPRGEAAADTRRAREAAEQCGLQLRTFSLEQLLLRSASAECIEDPREPIGAFREITRIGHDQGVSFLLSGRLGDLLTGNREPDAGLLVDLYRRRGLGAALRTLIAWAVFIETPLWQILGRMIRDRYFSSPESKLLVRYQRDFHQRRTADGQTRTLVGPLAQPLESAIAAWRFFRAWPDRSSLDYESEWWWFAFSSMRLSGTYRSAWSLHASRRTYAYSHRPLVEFAVGCPWDTFLLPARPRHLVHEHLGSLLPPSLINHVLKSDTATWRVAPLRDLWSATFSNRKQNPPRLVTGGLLDEAALDSVHASFAGKSELVATLGSRLVQLELWLRRRPRRLRAIEPTTKGGESHALREA